MGLGSTAALWGLGGMMIPFIIHLLSKQKQQEVSFGSIQFLQETASDRSRSIQLSQILLLGVRMLIVGIMTMMAAQLVIDRNVQAVHQVLVPVDLIDNPAYQSLMNKYSDETHEVIAYQHHRNEDCEDCLYSPSLNTLIHSTNQRQDSSTILSYGYLKNIKGKLPVVSSKTNIIQIPTLDSPIKQQIVIGDTLYSIDITDVNTNKVLQLTASDYNTESAEIRMCILSAQDRQSQKEEIENIVTSISQYIKYPIQYVCENPDWIITIDTTTTLTGVKTIQWNVNNEELSWESDGWDNYNIKGRINANDLRATNLPVLMAEALSSSMINYKNHETRILNLSEEIQYSLASSSEIVEAKSQSDISHYLWIVIILMLYGERRLSNQQAAE